MSTRVRWPMPRSPHAQRTARKPQHWHAQRHPQRHCVRTATRTSHPAAEQPAVRHIRRHARTAPDIRGRARWAGPAARGAGRAFAKWRAKQARGEQATLVLLGLSLGDNNAQRWALHDIADEKFGRSESSGMCWATRISRAPMRPGRFPTPRHWRRSCRCWPTAASTRHRCEHERPTSGRPGHWRDFTGPRVLWTSLTEP